MLTLTAAFVLGVTLGVQPALRFEPRTTPQGRVLLVHDCGRYARQACDPWETQFSGPGDYTMPDSSTRRYRGDAAVLADSMARARYDEVWLLTGGGQVVAGLGIARVLRSQGALVRVPSARAVVQSQGATRFVGGGMCASSCTIAFMGGALRQVDADAQYILHSPSVFSQGIPDFVTTTFRGGGLPAVAREFQENACQSVFASARLFQNTLQTPRRAPGTALFSEVASDANARECSSTATYEADQQRWDTLVLSLESIFALQDIGMRMERAAARHAIAYWQQRQDRFGAQFDDALQMIAAMYAAPITALVPLSSAELLALGYVTEFVEFERGR